MHIYLAQLAQCLGQMKKTEFECLKVFYVQHLVLLVLLAQSLGVEKTFRLQPEHDKESREDKHIFYFSCFTL